MDLPVSRVSRETKVSRVIADRAELLAILDKQVRQVQLEHRVHVASPEQRDRPEHQDWRASRVCVERRATRDSPVSRVFQDRSETEEQRVNLAAVVTMESLDRAALSEALDSQDRWVTWVTPGCADWPVRLDHRDLAVIQDQVDLLETREPLVHRVLRDRVEMSEPTAHRESKALQVTPDTVALLACRD